LEGGRRAKQTLAAGAPGSAPFKTTIRIVISLPKLLPDP
jgi:hypothetical protein